MPLKAAPDSAASGRRQAASAAITSGASTTLAEGLGEKLKKELNDDGFQGTLLAYTAGSKSWNANMSASYFKLREQGFTRHALVSYEGGPSGFSVPGRGLTKQDEEAIRIYGHSLATGIAALHCWLDTYRLGWAYHCYYFYGQGMDWNSHSTMGCGFLPSLAFLAVKMRNRAIRGDMLRVKVSSTPTMPHCEAVSPAKSLGKRKARPRSAKSEMPLVNCYAFRDGDRYSVIIIFLMLDGKHNGQDFGDGYSPITLRLPFKRVATITLHKLDDNPRDTNMTEENMKLVQQRVLASSLKDGIFRVKAATGGGKGGHGLCLCL